MKCLLFVAIAAAFAVSELEANRAKRFAGFGAFSAAGGRIGCVVSENGPNNASLYINSHFTKFLSEEELQELSTYKEKLAKFKNDVKTFLEQRQKQMTERSQQQFHQIANARTSENPQSQPSGQLQQPEPPKKPSFCGDKATTQFVFDGCSVQGDNVYVGENFVRKLTPEEQEELERFDKQFTAYQKQVTSNFRQQVEGIFGKQFGQFFGVSTSSSKGSEGSAVEASSESPAAAATGGPIEPPKTPNFCTLII